MATSAVLIASAQGQSAGSRSWRCRPDSIAARIGLSCRTVTEKRTSSLLAVAAGVVERTLSWITRYRRTDRGYERLPQHHETMVYLVHDHHHGAPARETPGVNFRAPLTHGS